MCRETAKKENDELLFIKIIQKQNLRAKKIIYVQKEKNFSLKSAQNGMLCRRAKREK